MAHAPAPALLARGPWARRRGRARLARRARTTPPAEQVAAADAAIQALRDRGSPEPRRPRRARLAGHRVEDGRLVLELQPLRWALRLVEGDASPVALGAVRHARQRGPLARRAAARRGCRSWAGRWALGAGGAVDPGESPAHTLVRELRRGVGGRARARPGRGARPPAAPAGHVRRPGLAARRAPRSRRTHEHDEHAWWPADVDAWPDEADDRAARAWRGCCVGALTLTLAAAQVRLSFTHSTIYPILLVVWLVPGLHRVEFVFGSRTASAGSSCAG